MKIKEILTKMPAMVTSDNFGFDNPEANKKWTKNVIKKQKEIIQDTADWTLFRSGNKLNGNIVLYNKKTGKGDYAVRYSSKDYKFIGETVTQLLLWRSPTSPYAIGITKNIFFNYFLRNYPAILSDAKQTIDGKEFWIQRMIEAVGLGYRVALANLNTHKIIWYNPDKDGDYEDWITKNNGWGIPGKYEALRYLISN